MEKRRFTRIPFTVPVVVHWGGTTLAAETSDLSLVGIRLVSLQSIPLNESVDLHIALPQACPPQSLTAHAVVVRQDDQGIGLAFTGMDFESFFIVAQLVSDGLGDRRRVAHEILDFLRCPPGDAQDPSSADL